MLAGSTFMWSPANVKTKETKRREEKSKASEKKEKASCVVGCPKVDREKIVKHTKERGRRKEEGYNFVVHIRRQNINGIGSNLSMLFMRSRTMS